MLILIGEHIFYFFFIF